MKFITVTPTNVKHRHYVARETYGGTFVVIATCTSEEVAKQICSALNFDVLNYLQGTAQVPAKHKAA